MLNLHVFFCLKLGLLSLDPSYGDEYLYLFFTCSFCILFPLIFSLIQLHFQLSKWKCDSILSNTDVSIWTSQKTIFLYFIAIICGSSFAAISLCNCYLFRQSIFSMGLSSYHQSQFQNKCFFQLFDVKIYHRYVYNLLH